MININTMKEVVTMVSTDNSMKLYVKALYVYTNCEADRNTDIYFRQNLQNDSLKAANISQELIKQWPAREQVQSGKIPDDAGIQ